MAEQFLARDIYPTWKRHLQGATRSAAILTPYLDYSLVRLVENAPDQVELIVVTDLSPDAGPANYRKKLLAIRNLLERRRDVRTLPRLHAKVLLVDEVEVIAGSQNFTTYARSSKEVTAVSNEVPQQAVVVISTWIQSAKPIDIDLVDRLLAATRDQAAEVDRAIDALQEHVLEIAASAEREQQERVRRQRQEAFRAGAAALKDRVAKTPWRLAMGAAYLVSGTATTDSDWYGQDEYSTMYGTNTWGERSGVDLTRWNRTNTGKQRSLHLQHLYFYPVIHLPAGTMVFARIAKTRITYVRNRVSFASPQTIGGRAYYLAIDFPTELTEGANLIVKVRPWSESNATHQIGILFDGGSYDIKWDRPGSGATAPLAKAAATTVIEELRDPGRGAKVLERMLKPFKFSELGRDRKNAAEFFGHKKHQLKLIEYEATPLFVAVTTT